MKHDTLFTIGAMFLGFGFAAVQPKPVEHGWGFIAAGVVACLLSVTIQIASGVRRARREAAEEAKRGVVTTTIREEQR